MWIVHIDLPKARHLVIYTSLAKKAALVPDLVVEGQFRSRQQADGHFGWTVMNDELGAVLPHGGKATIARSRKFRRNQFVANLGWPRRDVMETVVAHMKGLLYRKWTRTRFEKRLMVL